MKHKLGDAHNEVMLKTYNEVMLKTIDVVAGQSRNGDRENETHKRQGEGDVVWSEGADSQQKTDCDPVFDDDCEVFACLLLYTN